MLTRNPENKQPISSATAEVYGSQGGSKNSDAQQAARNSNLASLHRAQKHGARSNYEAIVRFRQMGYSKKAVAEILSLSPSTVYRLLKNPPSSN